MSAAAHAAVTDVDRAGLQRRTITTLRLAQVPSQAAVSGIVAVVALLVTQLLDSDRLAGTGSAAFTLGSALTSVPLAAFMRRRGRRPGLVRAFSAGSTGAVVAPVGGQVASYPLFVVAVRLRPDPLEVLGEVDPSAQRRSAPAS